MTKIKILILLFLGISTFNYAQNCNCESNFQWAKKTFEENDAGFQYIIDKKGISAYNSHNTEFLNKIKNVKSDTECLQTIYNWLTFFRSGHIAISKIQNANNNISQNPIVSQNSQKQNSNWETLKINQKEFEKYLDKNQNSDLEGIWEYGSYIFGIKKFDNEYKGFIIKSDFPEWKANEVKFRITNDMTSGIFYLKNKTAEDINRIEFYGKNYLQFGDIMFVKKYPKLETEKGVELFLKSLSSQKPFLDQINNNTLLLRIPSFNGSEKKDIDSVLVANKIKLESTENLIIDLRNNGGGSDNSFSKLIPYLYTNPIRTVRTQFYSTELNNKRMLDFYENYKQFGFSEDERNYFKEVYDILEKNKGKYITLQKDGKTVSEEKLEKISLFPKSIGIIVNHGNGSTTEQFLLSAKQSKKVKLFGTTTAGVLDVSNMYYVNSPCNEFKLGYSISKSLRIPDMAIDEKGIQPDYYIDKSIPDYNWIDFVNDILNEK